MISAKVIADSISGTGKRITTLQVTLHKFLVAQFNTHRVFSRNFSSSRAIPTNVLLSQVRDNPAEPVFWGKNQPGMQAEQGLDVVTQKFANQYWLDAANQAADMAEKMAKLGVHKQIVNRIIEPFVWVNGVVTSTEWENWFALRAHPDAQPEIQQLALCMKSALNASTPQKLEVGQWHLPFITQHKQSDLYSSVQLCKISAAKCARVSYNNFDGSKTNDDQDYTLFDKLAGSIPQHMSPLEHQATPLAFGSSRFEGNFRGWNQFRKLWEEIGPT